MAKRICVLEDNKDIRDMIELVLHDEDLDVFGFGDVAEFNAKARALEPDAFILDIMLPDGNGIDVCCQLKKDNATQNIPVLMMSANFNFIQMRDECPAQDFINKPFDIFDFAKRVKKQIAS